MSNTHLSPPLRAMPASTPDERKELWGVWEYIQTKLIEYWNSLEQDEAFGLSPEIASRSYEHVYIYFNKQQSNVRSFFYGNTGELGLWLDDLLQQINDAQFTDDTLCKMGRIALIGKLAKMLFSPLDAGQNQTAEDRILDHVANSQLFRDNRARIVEMALESIAAKRSAVGAPGNVRVLTGMFQLLMAPAGNVDQTNLSAPEVTAEYIRAMEGYYNAERERRLGNPEERDAYPQWASDMYARELIWARQCFVDQMFDLVTTRIETLKTSALSTSVKNEKDTM